jgi:hypothetical protein
VLEIKKVRLGVVNNKCPVVYMRSGPSIGGLSMSALWGESVVGAAAKGLMLCSPGIDMLMSIRVGHRTAMAQSLAIFFYD